jgi:hypothetical protein
LRDFAGGFREKSEFLQKMASIAPGAQPLRVQIAHLLRKKSCKCLSGRNNGNAA